MLALAVTASAAIVIIDTTSRVVAGKENDADTYLAFYRHTVIPLRARGIALLRLDHPGKDVTRGTRGSSAKKGDVDSEWLLSRTSEVTFELERQKERDGHGDGRLSLRRRFEPLRHEVTAGSGNRAGDIAAELDRLGVPRDAGRDRARDALKAAGLKATNADLAAAIRHRKLPVDLPGQEAMPGIPGPVRGATDSPDSPDPVPPIPAVRPSVTTGTDSRAAPARSKPGTCAGPDCNARPAGGAEYCQACRIGHRPPA